MKPKKRIESLLISLWMIFLLITSCAADKEAIIKQTEATRNLAEVYMAHGDYTSALTELIKAHEMNPNDPFIHMDLGLSYMAKGKLDLAVEHFKKSIELNPSFAPARNNLGYAYLAMKKWDEAIEIFKVLTEDLLYATPHYSFTNLGWAYFNKKEYSQAEKYYREAIRLQPDFVIAYRGLGNTYIQMGRYLEGIENLEKAIQLAPKFPDLYYDIGKAYVLVNDIPKALDAYRKFIAFTEDTNPLKDEVKNEIEKLKNVQPPK